MAQEASKEPTMEEILASIRKIISEDDAPQPPKAEPAPVRLDPNQISVTDDVFAADAADETPIGETAEEASPGGLSFEELVADMSAKAVEPVLDEVTEAEPEPDLPPKEEVEFEAEPFDDETFEEVTFEEDTLADEEEFLPPPPLVETVDEAPEVVAEAPEVPEPSIAVEASQEDHTPPARDPEVTPMAQTVQSISLTEEKTADAAAGALARLVAKMDMGSENTLEGIVRELLKPMLKEWLDQNLPQIVEDKVEAEVQRIARLAR